MHVAGPLRTPTGAMPAGCIQADAATAASTNATPAPDARTTPTQADASERPADSGRHSEQTDASSDAVRKPHYDGLHKRDPPDASASRPPQLWQNPPPAERLLVTLVHCFMVAMIMCPIIIAVTLLSLRTWFWTEPM